LRRDLRCRPRSGTEKLFVIEADEYDTAFFDKRSKFVHYRPRRQFWAISSSIMQTSSPILQR
jgi:UDP-N-acetylmuramate-alanine ligase